MAEKDLCDCCKRSVEVISDVGLCFVCETFQTFTAIIKDETELKDEAALDLATSWQAISFPQSSSACSRRIRRSSETYFKRWSGAGNHISVAVRKVAALLPFLV